VFLNRRSRTPCGGSGGVLGGHFVQQSAPPILGGCGLFQKGLELFLDQLFPLVFKLSDFFLDACDSFQFDLCHI